MAALPGQHAACIRADPLPAPPSTHLSLLSSTAWIACTRLRSRCTRRDQGPPGGSDMAGPAPPGARRLPGRVHQTLPAVLAARSLQLRQSAVRKAALRYKRGRQRPGRRPKACVSCLANTPASGSTPPLPNQHKAIAPIGAPSQSTHCSECEERGKLGPEARGAAAVCWAGTMAPRAL